MGGRIGRDYEMVTVICNNPQCQSNKEGICGAGSIIISESLMVCTTYRTKDRRYKNNEPRVSTENNNGVK